MPVESEKTLLAKPHGTWSTDCGAMTVNGVEVWDASDDLAYLKVTARNRIQLHFSGEVWRSTYVGDTYIKWEGEGDPWMCATPGAVSSIDRGPPPMQSYAPTTGIPHELSATASLAMPAHAAAVWSTATLPCLSSHAPSVQWAHALPPGGQTMLPLNLRGGPGAPQPPMHAKVACGPSAQNIPQLSLLEAKVDFLTHSVFKLQSEIGRMMYARGAAAQRRAGMAPSLAPALLPPSEWSRGQLHDLHPGTPAVYVQWNAAHFQPQEPSLGFPAANGQRVSGTCGPWSAMLPYLGSPGVHTTIF